jgi:hypothetical protein
MHLAALESQQCNPAEFRFDDQLSCISWQIGFTICRDAQRGVEFTEPLVYLAKGIHIMHSIGEIAVLIRHADVHLVVTSLFYCKGKAGNPISLGCQAFRLDDDIIIIRDRIPAPQLQRQRPITNRVAIQCAHSLSLP